MRILYPARIPAAPLRPMLHSSKRARGAQRANLKAAKQPRTTPPAQRVRNAVHDGCAPGMLSADACGAPFLTTAVLMFTSMSVVHFWRSAPSISEEAKAFAKAIQRMHNIFRACDAEFRDLSEAANEHGRKSEQCKEAALRLQACQQRRTREFSLIEASCGPAQEAYRLCVEQTRGTTADAEYQCLPVLHTFIDCAERALQKQAKQA